MGLSDLSLPQFQVISSLFRDFVKQRVEGLTSALHIFACRLGFRLCDRAGDLPNIHHRGDDAEEGLGASLVESSEHCRQQLLPFPLIFHEGGDARSSDKGNILLEALVADKTVADLSPLSMAVPLLATFVFRTLPAEFNSPLLYGTREKGAANLHAALALASAAPAAGLAVVAGAKPA